MIQIKDKENCCGCGACKTVCSRKCISFEEDNEGFLYPKVDLDRCTDCGRCEEVCPMLHPSKPQNPQLVLAAKNKHNDLRLESSSGGVFVALAQTTIAAGGVVFGAVFNDRWGVEHTWTDSMEGVRPMMRSKYVQSNTGSTFAEAKAFLREGRRVLYVGTPCQISALKNYLGKDHPLLLVVSLLCHGVPSPGLWQRFLKEQYGGAEKIAAVNFRDKEPFGGKDYAFTIRLKDGRQFSSEPSKIGYMLGFYKNLTLRPSCHHCPCKRGADRSDLAIGDFWGVEHALPDFDDDGGISLMMVGTDKGRENVEQLPATLMVPTSLEVATKYCCSFMRSSEKHAKRKLLFKMLSDKSCTLERAVSICTEKSKLRKILAAAVKMLKSR